MRQEVQTKDPPDLMTLIIACILAAVWAWL